jgi:uncharacterized protein YggU (UPF0235/DUF167 family)
MTEGMPRARAAVRLQPRARTNAILGDRDGRLLVRVTAPPLDGRANEALCELLAARLDVPKGAITVIRGGQSRDKLVEVDGLSEDELRRRLTPG